MPGNCSLLHNARQLQVGSHLPCSAACGIPGGVFVHASGFIGGNDSLEGAVAMAAKALEME